MGYRALEEVPELVRRAKEPAGRMGFEASCFDVEDPWPEEWRVKPDEVWESWLNHPDLVATELLVMTWSVVIVGILKRET